MDWLTAMFGVLKKLTKRLYGLAQKKGFQDSMEIKYRTIILKTVYLQINQNSITQMIPNMIDNSIKYTNKGSIEIRLIKTLEQRVLVEIEDTGIGMSEEIQKKLFTPFTQEEQGYTRKYDGSGLGLSLVQKYAKINKTNLTFTSTKDVGTTFRIDLTKIVK